MKKQTNKLSFWLVGCLVMLGLSFAACNPGGDDNHTLTPEQQQQAYQQARGNYAGKLFFSRLDATNGNIVKDSTAIRWEINTDSTLIIKAFPMRLFAEYVNDNALKAALRNAPDQDIKCFTYYYHLNPVGFFINPVSPVFTLNYGGQDHKISIAFFIRNSYSFGVLNSARLSQMQIIAASLQVDAMSATYLKESVGFVFQGNGSR